MAIAFERREAMAFLTENAFKTPTFFLDPDVIGRLEAAGVSDRVVDVQRRVLTALIDEDRIKRMSEISARDRGTYTAVDMLSDITAGVWSELDSRSPSVDLYRRNLQRAHVELLAERMDSSDNASDLPALARGELVSLRSMCGKALGRRTNRTTTLHIGDVMARINLALEKVKVVEAGGGN